MKKTTQNPKTLQTKHESKHPCPNKGKQEKQEGLQTQEELMNTGENNSRIRGGRKIHKKRLTQEAANTKIRQKSREKEKSWDVSRPDEMRIVSSGTTWGSPHRWCAWKSPKTGDQEESQPGSKTPRLGSGTRTYETHFGHLFSQPYSFSRYPDVFTSGEVWDGLKTCLKDFSPPSSAVQFEPWKRFIHKKVDVLWAEELPAHLSVVLFYFLVTFWHAAVGQWHISFHTSTFRASKDHKSHFLKVDTCFQVNASRGLQSAFTYWCWDQQAEEETTCCRWTLHWCVTQS